MNERFTAAISYRCLTDTPILFMIRCEQQFSSICILDLKVAPWLP